jgi:hypothetical protein
MFPISSRVYGGTDRKTHKMLEQDLMAARDKWLDEAKTEEEKNERLEAGLIETVNVPYKYCSFVLTLTSSR